MALSKSPSCFNIFDVCVVVKSSLCALFHLFCIIYTYSVTIALVWTLSANFLPIVIKTSIEHIRFYDGSPR